MTDVHGSDELIDHGRTGLVVANRARRDRRGARADGAGRTASRPVSPGDRGFSGFRGRANDGRALVELINAVDPVTSPPKVTILIPTCNQERFIDQAVSSALAQDFPSLEVIVIDDASTDGTGQTAKRWAFDRRFRYVRNDHNLGRVANYRHALYELARGEWVLVLDGDDFLADPGFIRRACEALERNADRPIVFAQAGHRVKYLDGSRSDVDILPPIDGPDNVLTGGDYSAPGLRQRVLHSFGHALSPSEPRSSAGFTRPRSARRTWIPCYVWHSRGEILVLNTIAGNWVQHGANASSSLPLADLPANVRIFREVARLAVRSGQSSWRKLEGPLTRYEAVTLVHLFGTMIGKSARAARPAAVARDRPANQPAPLPSKTVSRRLPPVCAAAGPVGDRATAARRGRRPARDGEVAMHPAVFQVFESICSQAAIQGPVLEVGAVPGPDSLLRMPCLSHLESKVGLNLDGGVLCDGYDIKQGNANAMTDFADGQFAAVLCNAVLEHDRCFWKTVAEIRRVTAPGGLIAIGVPGYAGMGPQTFAPRNSLFGWISRAFEHGPYADTILAGTLTLGVHNYPGDFYRFSEQAVRDVFMAGLADVELRTVLNPPRFIAWGRKP